jgi:hypothetical protein
LEFKKVVFRTASDRAVDIFANPHEPESAVTRQPYEVVDLDFGLLIAGEVDVKMLH